MELELEKGLGLGTGGRALTSTSQRALELVAEVADWRSVVRRNTCSLPLYSSHVRNFSCSAWNSRTTSPCRWGVAQEGPGPPPQVLPLPEPAAEGGQDPQPDPKFRAPQLGQTRSCPAPAQPSVFTPALDRASRQYPWPPRANPESPLHEGRRGGPPGAISPGPSRPALGASCPSLRSPLSGCCSSPQLSTLRPSLAPGSALRAV